MIFHFRFPDLLTRHGIHGVDIALDVSKINGILCSVLSLDSTNGDGVAHSGICLERPVHASGPFVNRVDAAAIGADKNASRGDRGLRPHDFRGGQAEGPLQLELRNIIGSHPGSFR